LNFEMVFAVFLRIEFEKHDEHNSSPEYFLEKTTSFWHLLHFMLVFPSRL